MEGRIFNVRRLVALDIVLHGPKFILTEFGVGTPAILAAGAFLFWSGDPDYLGLYLILTGINYIPVLAYAILIVRDGTAHQETDSELAENPHLVRKYSVQQFLIFVPFSIIVLTLVQLRSV